MEKYVTECSYCGKEIDHDPKLFAEGEHGEPVCNDCKKGDA